MAILTSFQRSDFANLISWIGNKELMVTIAGTEWTYPLTPEQLEVYLNKPNSHSFNIVAEEQNTSIGHAEIILYEDGTCKIDKLIIGDPAYRGRGLCPQVMEQLTAFAFNKLPVHTVELNVFDWNSGAIRCYEKVGFKLNPAKQQTFEIGEKKWVTLNMTIKKSNQNSDLTHPQESN